MTLCGFFYPLCYDLAVAEVGIKKLRHALKILSETEKQLRTSRNQAKGGEAGGEQTFGEEAAREEDAVGEEPVREDQAGEEAAFGESAGVESPGERGRGGVAGESAWGVAGERSRGGAAAGLQGREARMRIARGRGARTRRARGRGARTRGCRAGGAAGLGVYQWQFAGKYFQLQWVFCLLVRSSSIGARFYPLPKFALQAALLPVAPTPKTLWSNPVWHSSNYSN